jgi:ABC-2 type transport system permease protein
MSIKLNKHLATAQMAAYEKMNGGLLFLLPDILIKICTLIPLLFLWRSAMAAGAETGMSIAQMLSYTYVSMLLGDLLVVRTAATGWLSEGVLLKLYGRPLTILAQLAAQTCGGWIPSLLLFSLPMAAASSLFGVRLIPASPLFPISLFLCITLGFAIDTLFACLSIKLRNMSWLIGRLRLAVVTVFSGAVIPVSLLPFGLAEIMKYQPFASLGGAALSIFTGIANSGETLVLQIGWNLILWPAALWVFKKSQEGMVSYGG